MHERIQKRKTHDRYYDRSNEITWTIPRLVNLPNLLLRKEFYELLIGNYEEYKREYYKQKMSCFFKAFYDKKWFSDRMQKKEEDIMSKYNAFISKNICKDIIFENESFEGSLLHYMNKNIMIRNIDEDCNENDLREFAMKCPGYLNFEIILNYKNGIFTRYGLISLNDDAIIEESIAFLRSISDKTFCFEPVILNEVQINKTPQAISRDDKWHINRLLKYYQQIYSVKFPFNDENIDYNILLLRYVFNHCYYCVKKYDTHLEMRMDCGDYHIRSDLNKKRSIFDRKQFVFVDEKDLSLAKEQVLYNYDDIVKLENDNYLCLICEKGFDTMDNFMTHCNNRHRQEFMKKEQEIERNAIYKEFVDKIGLKLLSIIDGNYDWEIDRNIIDLNFEYSGCNSVVYDLPKIFSGEIAIKK